MSDDVGHSAPRPAASRLRRFFLEGVLPEVLGLGFVLIILAGFTAAYLISDHAWGRQAHAAQRASVQTLAQTLAATAGAASSGPEETARLLKQAAVQMRLTAVRWTGAGGAVLFDWPPAGPSGAGSAGPSAPRSSGAGVLTATVPLRTTDEPAGTLRVEVPASSHALARSHLLWVWGVAAVVTLLLFTGVYQRLHRHLRPVAAIERNLESFARGCEKELVALTLSDSLGQVARAWNLLIAQTAELQQCAQRAAAGGQTSDVLTRFENAAFRRVVDRLPFGVLYVGRDETVNYANASAAVLLGRPTEQIVGQPVGVVCGNPAATQAVLGVQARSGSVRSFDHTRQDGDHETMLRFRAVGLGDAAGGEALLTIEDVGHLREDQRARDNFLYHVTHELRTPLTNIRAYAETLTKPDFDDEQTRKECYNVIISETNRLSSLVENILSLSQLEVGTARLDLGEVDLVRLVRQMVQDHLGAADDKRIDLTLSLPPKLPKVRGDKQRLAVLLTNLIGNALKYTPEGGQVHIQVEVRGAVVEIAVRDTGIGIAAEDQPRVFEKFFRVASDAVQMIPGTGLGLAIAREVARLHGGEIRLVSEPGQGTTFTVELPLSGSPAEEVSAQ